MRFDARKGGPPGERGLGTRNKAVLELVGREEEHLLGVSSRLFGGCGQVTAAWLEGVLAAAEGIDRLESFVGKFSRMQDTRMDKLLPTFLVAIGERSNTALDNLNLAHRLRFVTDPEAWLAMRVCVVGSV